MLAPEESFQKFESDPVLSFREFESDQVSSFREFGSDPGESSQWLDQAMSFRGFALGPRLSGSPKCNLSMSESVGPSHSRWKWISRLSQALHLLALRAELKQKQLTAYRDGGKRGCGCGDNASCH